ncbi:LAFA_0F18514g1_1 [Lachancea sp. 'fantastica']|nr:LAFA_0F18514g1_1 [Lachancea sp. 'fantastica']
MVSNTVIITAGYQNATENGALERIREFLEATVLKRFEVTEERPLKLVALPAMNRCVLVCPSLELAEQTVLLHSQWPSLNGFKFQYSAIDVSGSAEKQYLELPKERALFLVSPPTSPPPGFDYSRLEEAPNRVRGLQASGHVPEAFQPRDHHHKLTGESQKILLHHSHTSITLEQCDQDPVTARMTPEDVSVRSDQDFNGSQLPSSISQFRTAVPPRSIFDDID